MKIGGIGPGYRQKLAKVISASRGGITSESVSLALSVSRQEAGRLLARWSKAGWLRRVKRGFYIEVPLEASPDQFAIENPWIVVSQIYSPGYFGGFSAIKHWDLSEQIFETVVFFTIKAAHSRNPIHSGIKIRLKTISPEKIFGTKTLWIDSSKLLVSDPSKTIVDILDEPALVGGMRIVRDFFEAYINSDYKNFQLLIGYAKRMGNKTILKRLGFLLEAIGSEEREIIEKLKEEISSGYSKFDPSIENERIVKRWNLKVPKSWVNEHDRKK